MASGQTNFNDEAAVQITNREAEARASYINWRMLDVPTIYRELMPYTFDAAELLEAETAIRCQLTEDMKLVASPWRHVVAGAMTLDWGNVSNADRVTFGLENQRMVGMPAVVKRGRDLAGKLYREYPEVVAATENSQRTAQAVALERERELRSALHAANAEYVEASNKVGDGDGRFNLSEFSRRLKAAADEHAAAEAEVNRLRDNPIAACMIVRDAPRANAFETSRTGPLRLISDYQLD